MGTAARTRSDAAVTTSGEFEITTAGIALELFPVFAPAKEGSTKPGIIAHASLPTNLDKAERRTEGLKKRYRHHFKMKDRRALRQLIDNNPTSLFDPEILDMHLEILKTERLAGIRGRPPGSGYRTDLEIMCMVASLIAHGNAKTKDEAFHHLASLGFAGSYDNIKKAFYRGLQNRNRRALLLRNRELGRRISRHDLEQLLQETERPIPTRASPGETPALRRFQEILRDRASH